MWSKKRSGPCSVLFKKSRIRIWFQNNSDSYFDFEIFLIGGYYQKVRKIFPCGPRSEIFLRCLIQIQSISVIKLTTVLELYEVPEVAGLGLGHGGD